MKERLRTFVAVELSDETRASLGRETARLAALGANVRWVAPSNIHVTLKFQVMTFINRAHASMPEFSI